MSRPPPSQPTEDDLQNPKVAASALDFLLTELVPLAQRVTEQLQAREQVLIDEYKRSKIFNKASTDASTVTNGGSTTGKDGGVQGNEWKGVTSLGFPPVREETREAMFWRLDSLGYRVGQGLVERFSAGKPRPQTPLDSIKFICKDLWLLLFRKQIDNLKTNHRGVFVLTDNRFQPLSRMSIDRRVVGPRAGEEAIERAMLHLYFPSGVIRGALSGLGIEATVAADSSEIPAATFQITTKGAKP